MTTEYTTTAGTTPDVDEQHQPRTVQRKDDDELYMMTEIGDGVFVQWGTCARCSKRVSECRDAGGPVEPAYIERWRVNRFADSFEGRGVKPALPVTHKLKDRRINAVLRLLRGQGWTITNPEGDSLSLHEYAVNSLSERQGDMVAAAIDAVQDVDPEGPDPEQDPDNLTGMDLGDGLSPDYTSEEQGDDVLDASALNGADLAARAAEATEDDLEFARDTLGPSATQDEVQALADDRAARDARELLKDREDQFDAGF